MFSLFSSLCACLGVIFVVECFVELYLLSAGVSIEVQAALLNLTLSCIMFNHIFHCSYKPFRHICVGLRDDVLYAFVIKQLPND